MLLSCYATVLSCYAVELVCYSTELLCCIAELRPFASLAGRTTYAVEPLTAEAALARYSPHVVVISWMPPGN